MKLVAVLPDAFAFNWGQIRMKPIVDVSVISIRQHPTRDTALSNTILSNLLAIEFL
jgi:hypothetical protein